MAQENPIPFESMDQLTQPPTLGEVVYQRDGKTYGLKILKLGDGYQLIRTTLENQDGFNIIVLAEGQIILNKDDDESRNEAASILQDINDIIASKKK